MRRPGRPRNPFLRDLFGRKLPRRPRDANAEFRRQCAIVKYVRFVAPDIRIWAVPNGGWRDKVTAQKMVGAGVLAGVWDLTLALPAGRSAYWEVKTDDSDLSDDQIAFGEAMSSLGHQLAVVRSIDDARAELHRLGVKTKEAKGKESTSQRERAIKEESTIKRERAKHAESTISRERAKPNESTNLQERANQNESTKTRERAMRHESTGYRERAIGPESTKRHERARSTESAITTERANMNESTNKRERAK